MAVAKLPRISSYSEAERELGSRSSKKIANNTYLVRLNEYKIAVRYHETDIAIFSQDNAVQLSTGGWYTMTTLGRLRQIIAPYPLSIACTKGVWSIAGRTFEDGMVVYENGQTLFPSDLPF